MGQNVQCPPARAAPRVVGMSLLKRFRVLLVLPAALFAGCNMVLLHPAGAVAAQQGHLIVVSTVLMLLVIVPVMALTVVFAWRYRKSNREATYTPDWDHSTQLELMIWAVPLLIIIALGAVTWINTHTLDPYRPLRPHDAAHPVAADTKPLTVEVVALDWKWLFIYPEQGIAVVNELAAPVDVPITFKITASSVMNSFFIPALAGQIYAMPGMQTELHAVMNRAGDYDGFSANYSGAGFSDMRFKFHASSAGDFEHWVQAVKAGGQTLDRAGYLRLERPSEHDPVRRYATVADGLYDSILGRTVSNSNLASANPASANLASDNTGARAP
jgi:cytochrome o ubiquinol oxidase subunit 2